MIPTRHQRARGDVAADAKALLALAPDHDRLTAVLRELYMILGDQFGSPEPNPQAELVAAYVNDIANAVPIARAQLTGDLQAAEAKPADVLPINAPGRADLWRRHLLAMSLLSHRACTRETMQLVIDVLDGIVPADGSVPRGA